MFFNVGIFPILWPIFGYLAGTANWPKIANRKFTFTSEKLRLSQINLLGERRSGARIQNIEQRIAQPVKKLLT